MKILSSFLFLVLMPLTSLAKPVICTPLKPEDWNKNHKIALEYAEDLQSVKVDLFDGSKEVESCVMVYTKIEGDRSPFVDMFDLHTVKENSSKPVTVYSGWASNQRRNLSPRAPECENMMSIMPYSIDSAHGLFFYNTMAFRPDIEGGGFISEQFTCR
jgi:hypothetical protein